MPKTKPPEPEVYALTIRDATIRYSLSRSAIYRMLSEGKLRARKLCGRTIILDSDLRELVAAAPVAEFRRPPAAT